MGKVASKVIKRPLKNFNVENRAHKLVDKDVKPIPAPHHSSSADFIDNFITGFDFYGFVLYYLLRFFNNGYCMFYAGFKEINAIITTYFRFTNINVICIYWRF